MNARLSESANGHRPHRVVSVSPLTVHTADPPSPLLRIARTDEHDAALPPTGDDDTSQLTQLVKRAERLIQQLGHAADQAEQDEALAKSATRSLQERLRISARMLQAFQSQIVRIESALAELEQQRIATAEAVERDAARLDDQAAAFEQRLEAIMASFEKRISAHPQDR
jgi:DNA repair exonuclease SbcCD ATPase subunit